MVQPPWNTALSTDRTDAELLHHFLSHEDNSAEAAFAALVQRHGPIVHRVCLDVLGDVHQSQDAAQAVFLVLSRKARSIQKPDSLGSWLHSVTLRVARHVRKDAARRRAAERHKAEIMRQRDHAEFGAESMDHAELHEEIDRLPDKYRHPIILCYIQGRTQPEAAQLLGWPLGTVQTRLHRGRERLRSRLSRSSIATIALTRSDLTKALSQTAGALERDWIEATARAAVRFAAGKATAGLVAPPVAGLAASMLAAMLFDSIKVITLFTIATLAAAGLALAASQRAAVSTELRSVESGVVLAVSQTRPEPAPEDLSAKSFSRPGRVDQKSLAAARAIQPGRSVKTKATTELEPRKAAEPTRIPSREHPLGDHSNQSRITAHGQNLGTSLRLGRELFERIWLRNDPRSHGGDGLGPVFNAQSCVACHNLGGPGGAGTLDRNIEIATASRQLPEYMGFSYSFSMDFGAGRFDYRLGSNPQGSSHRESPADIRFLAALHAGFQDSRSVVLHRFGIDPTYNSWRESVPGRHGPVLIRSSERNPPPLFGSGRLDAIADQAIEAAARRKPSGSAQLKGRVSRLKDGRIGRFGWKAQTATLEEFVLSAAAGELGLEIPSRHQAADPRLPGLAASGLDMDQQECNLLVDYVRNLPVPVAVKADGDKDNAQIKAGEAAFKAVGCTNCHLPKLGDVEGIYSDLLLHDMGSQLADADTYTVFSGEPPQADRAGLVDRVRGGTDAASAREWRTPPLWGLRDSAPYLHDGRAASIAEAITLHGGQGSPSARRYAELSPRRKQQIEAFLMSLAPPAIER